MKATAIVIGYGNNLRSDDGIGQIIADEIACWGLSGVKSLAVQQLTPELADVLAKVELAIFVDACVPCEYFDVQVRSLFPSTENAIATHTANPQSLLALTQTLYGHCPLAFWVTVPAINWEFGDRISQTTETGKAIALERIIQLLDEFNNVILSR